MTSYHFTKLQLSVFNRAKRWLKKKTWYRGVCCDRFPDDRRIRQIGLDGAVKEVMDETAYWDMGKD